MTDDGKEKHWAANIIIMIQLPDYMQKNKKKLNFSSMTTVQ